MLQTTEARWFIRGNLPPTINDWCNDKQNSFIKQTPRTDYYLSGFKTSDLGVKYREEKLEFKQTLQNKKKLLIIKSFTGILQDWKKWSFILQDNPAFVSMINDKNIKWTTVNKERWLKYFIDEQGTLKTVSFNEEMTTACQFEICKLSNSDLSKQWWTIGFEAFGNNAEQLLRRVADKVLNQNRIFENLNMNAMSYPEWIKVL